MAIRPQPRKKKPHGLVSGAPSVVVVVVVVVVVLLLLLLVEVGGLTVVVDPVGPPAAKQAHTLQTVVSTNRATGHCGTGWEQPSAG